MSDDKVTMENFTKHMEKAIENLGADGYGVFVCTEKGKIRIFPFSMDGSRLEWYKSLGILKEAMLAMETLYKEITQESIRKQ